MLGKSKLWIVLLLSSLSARAEGEQAAAFVPATAADHSTNPSGQQPSFVLAPPPADPVPTTPVATFDDPTPPPVRVASPPPPVSQTDPAPPVAPAVILQIAESNPRPDQAGALGVTSQLQAYAREQIVAAATLDCAKGFLSATDAAGEAGLRLRSCRSAMDSAAMLEGLDRKTAAAAGALGSLGAKAGSPSQTTGDGDDAAFRELSARFGVSREMLQREVERTHGEAGDIADALFAGRISRQRVQEAIASAASLAESGGPSQEARSTEPNGGASRDARSAKGTASRKAGLRESLANSLAESEETRPSSRDGNGRPIFADNLTPERDALLEEVREELDCSLTIFDVVHTKYIEMAPGLDPTIRREASR